MIAVAVGPASAAPQGAWVQPAADLSATGGSAFNPQVATAPDGTATAVWRRSNGSNDIIQAATRAPGGSFGAPVDLSETGQSATAPQIATAPDGTTTAVWTRSNGSNVIVQAATRPPGGSFGDPVDLSGTGKNANFPGITTAPDGTSTAIWRHGNFIVQAATRPPGGSFGDPVDLSGDLVSVFGPQIAAAPDGTATVVWYRSNGSNNIIQSATRPPGGDFGASVDISAVGGNALGPQITTAPDGTTGVVWSRHDGSGFIAQVATRPPSGTFGASIDLSATGQNAFGPQITIAHDGTTTALWYRSDGSDTIIQAATRPPGGSFSDPIDLSVSGQDADRPQLATAPDGTATAVWRRDDGSNDIIQATTRPPSGSFGAPVDLSAVDQNANFPQINTAPDGTATAIWQRINGSDSIIQAMSTARPSPLLGVAKTGSGEGTVSSNPSGIECGDDCAETYLSYTKVTLSATSDPGSTFDGWGGACEGSVGNTCELTMLEEQNVTSTFESSPDPPPPAGEAKLKITKFKPKKPKVKRGKKTKIKVTGKNVSDATATDAKLCLKLNKKLKKKLKPKGKTCQKLGSLAPGQTKKKPFKLKATKKAKKGKNYKAPFKLTAGDADPATSTVKVKVK